MLLQAPRAPKPMCAPALRTERRAQTLRNSHRTRISVWQMGCGSSHHPRGLMSGVQSPGSSQRLGASWRRERRLNLEEPAGPGSREGSWA